MAAFSLFVSFSLLLTVGICHKSPLDLLNFKGATIKKGMQQYIIIIQLKLIIYSYT